VQTIRLTGPAPAGGVEVSITASDVVYTGSAAVTGLRFEPAAAVAGTATTGTVTVKNPAPHGGTTVDLWSNTAYGPSVYVPPFVVVEAGRTTATFTALVTSAESPAVVRPSADLG
jgi:hypothetical protein